jgi:hypothetical protein
MTAEREKIMQGRAERGEQLAQAADQDGVTASIKRQHVKTSKNGYSTQGRKVGVRSKKQNRLQNADSRFDEGGESIEKPSEFACCDRDLATNPGSQAAADALRIWKAERDLK